MKKHWNFIIYKWNSLLLVISTLWLATLYLSISFEFMAVAALVFAIVKLIGIITNHTGNKFRYKGEIYEVLIDNFVWTPETYPAGVKKL